MKSNIYLYYSVAFLSITSSLYAGHVTIEDHVRTPTILRRAPVACMQEETVDSHHHQSVLSYNEFFSKNLLFSVTQKKNIPKSLKIKYVLLNALDEYYENDFIDYLRKKHPQTYTPYAQESLESIKENINFIINDLKKMDGEGKTSLTHFNEFMSHYKILNNQIFRFEKAFLTREKQKLYQSPSFKDKQEIYFLELRANATQY